MKKIITLILVFMMACFSEYLSQNFTLEFTETARYTKLNGDIRDIAIGPDGTIFVAHEQYGLRAYEYDGSSITNTAHIDDGGEAMGVAVSSQGTIFLANRLDGLRAYTYDGSSFANTDHINDDGDALGVTVADYGYIYLANGSDGLRVYIYDESFSLFERIAHINEGGGADMAIGADSTIFLCFGGLSGGLSAYKHYGYYGTSLINTAHIDDVTGRIAVFADKTIFLANRSDGLKAYTYDGSSFTNTAHTDDFHAGKVFVSSDGTIFVNCSDGFKAYTYDGNSFTNIAHMNDTTFVLEITDEGTIFCRKKGIIIAYEYSPIQSETFWEKSLDITGGSEWDSYVSSIAANSEGHLYSFYYYDCDSATGGKEAFLFSDDNGDTWLEKSIIDTNSLIKSYNLTINNHGDIFAWAGPPRHLHPGHYTGLFRSTDNGETWTILSDDICSCVLINSVGVIYIDGWKRSYDNGDSWEYIWADKAYRNIWIDQSDNIYASAESGVYLSTDSGENWSLLVGGVGGELSKNSKGDLFIMTPDQLLILPEGSGTTSVVLDSIYPGMYDNRDLFIDNEDNIYFLNQEGEILSSSDNGTNWTVLNSGIDGLDVSCIVQNADGYLFVGTNDGIYRSIDPITNVKENISVEKLPNEVHLSQNYPNPFNPSTTIKYSIPKQSTVTLKVYDVLGRLVATLVNQKQPQGNYEVEFDGTTLTSGIYFYRLQAGDPEKSSGQVFGETRKMILMK